MATIRKVALGLIAAAVVAVLAVAVVQFWNYTQGDTLPPHPSYTPGVDERSRILQEQVETLAGRVADMQLLVLVLLGTSGLYAIVFVASSYFSAKSFARLADRTIAHMKNDIGVAMDNLRELQEQTQRRLGLGVNDQVPREERAVARDALENCQGVSANWEARVASMTQRTTQWQGKELTAQQRLELLHYEADAAYLDMAGEQRLAVAVAGLYRNFAEIYAVSDPLRARFYLDRALVFAFAEPQLASEIRYHLACWFAATNDFEQAMDSLKAAFQQPSKMLDGRLATDLEEGGRLYRLAATPPYDKQLNDLLLNVRIP